VRVERELARRARQHLHEALDFCLYDRSRNLVLTIGDESAAAIIDGRLQVDMTQATPATAPTGRAATHLLAIRRRLRRAVLANAAIYQAAQRMRGRSFTRDEILRIQERELAGFSADPTTPREPVARIARGTATLDADTCVVSGGLDWQHKDLRGLWSLKQTCRFRYCAIVYDLIPLNFPHFVATGYDTVLTDYFGELMWLADHAMCISQATRRDWLAYCGGFGVDMPAHVFPLGCDLPEEGAQAELPEALQGKRFALFVSTIEPRKNHRMLYEAWDRCIRSNTIDRERDRLVFVGRRGWAIDDLMRELAANPATRDTILVLNHVPDALLGTLYRQCAVVLFPSFYEGYGLPVAEALGHGKPCISSDAGSLPEIGGDLVLRLDPKDTLRWAEAIAHYLSSVEELAAWSARIRTQHRPVTWDDAASRFFGMIKEVAP
jgi:glycosyltransferase involved in cell wall biosynthesis